MDIGSVPDEIGILPEHRGVPETPPGVNGPTWASGEKREGGRRGPATLGAPHEESYSHREEDSPLPSRSRRRGERRGREEGKGGRRPPSLVLFRLGRGGARGHLLPPLLFSLRAHEGPITPGRVPVTPRYSGKMLISHGTIPMSKYRLPIYQSLCLDHFKTPHHVRDHIRDSGQTSVHQNL